MKLHVNAKRFTHETNVIKILLGEKAILNRNEYENEKKWNENPSVISSQQTPCWSLHVVGQISAFVLPPKYMRRRQWHNIGYNQYVVGEVREIAFNPLV